MSNNLSKIELELYAEHASDQVAKAMRLLLGRMRAGMALDALSEYVREIEVDGTRKLSAKEREAMAVLKSLIRKVS